MIVAAGLTPAWQHMLVFDLVRVGEVNRARATYSCASGKVTNVALALHFLGGRHRSVISIGGIPGGSIKEEFETLGVDCRWLETRCSTRECTTVMDRTTSQTTELVQNGEPLDADEFEAFIAAYAEEVCSASSVILSGSLPPGAGTDFYRRLLDVTPSTARTVLDIRGAELLATLDTHPFLVKPNREELGMTVGREMNTDADLQNGIAELHDRGAQNVLISDGSDPLWLSTTDGMLQIHTLPVNVVNPIACGDCLAAGIAWALENSTDLTEAVRFGVAAATENAAAMLPSRLDTQRVRELMQKVTVAAADAEL